MRTEKEIVKAHDALAGLFFEGAPDLEFTVTEKSKLALCCSVLCWILRHDHNETFDGFLREIASRVEAAGFELSTMPTVTDPASPEPVHDKVRSINPDDQIMLRAWQKFFALAYRQSATDDEKRQLHGTFFAGAFCAFQEMQKATRDAQSPSEGIKLLRRIEAEVRLTCEEHANNCKGRN